MTHVRASVLIYTLVLVNLALIMALVVLDNAFLLSTNTEIQNVNRTLSAHILAKGKNSIKYTEYLNSNGSGFVDAISCPQSVTMS
ncbi:MAG: hypothetical protein H6767_04190 [Candidatus Peribacteria bacterium]|nr:MAG: hypothetical protein H6767_04190 [Candidatus Peribacteria bacterium]